MDTVKFCGIALISVFLGILLRQMRPEFSQLITLASCVLLLLGATACISPLISYLKELEGGEMSNRFSLLLKALALGILTQTTAEICRDAGDSAIASKIELFGKAEILVLALPLITELLNTARNLLQL